MNKAFGPLQNPHLTVLLRQYLIVSFCFLFAGCATHAPLTPTKAPPLALEEILGEWHIIAHFPYFFENGKVATRVVYRQRSDGKYDDIFYFRKENFSAPEQNYRGTAVNLDPTSNRIWESTFLWPFSIEWHIISLDADNGSMVIGHPSRDYAWIMARASSIDQPTYLELKNKLTESGFDAEKLKLIPQPEAVNKTPGHKAKGALDAK